MKRERNAKNQPAGGKSQLKVNEKAMTVICQICRQRYNGLNRSFMQTIKKPDLEIHFNAKHSGKEFKAAFPSFA